MSEKNHKNMGIGELGNINFKSKLRWTVELVSQDEKEVYLKPTFVKVASRPIITWIPGKQEWQEITFSIFEANSSDFLDFYSWLGKQYDFASTKSKEDLEKEFEEKRNNHSELSATCKLNLYGGCGNPLEAWTLYECWAKSINFGELDHNSSESLTIEITLFYKTIKYEITNK